MKRIRRQRFMVAAVALILVAGRPAPAQDVESFVAQRPAATVTDDPSGRLSQQDQTYSADLDNVTFIGAPEFRPVDSTTTWAHDGQGYLYRTGGSTSFWAPIHLPPGALIGAVCFYYYDNAATAIDFNLAVFEIHDDAAPTFTVIVNDSSAGASATYRSTCPVSSHVFREVANYDAVGPAGYGAYRLVFNLQETNNNHRLGGAYIIWRRTITPAPLTASFTDVPTSHPYFQYIETMRASGISTGCRLAAPALYCPDAPVTHGQLALFMARALGLYWRW